jgi:predicted metalloprotease with PDZ domain
MLMDDSVSLFDPDKNSLLQISFADYKKGFLRFRMVNAHRGQRGLDSKQFIVPVIASVLEGSCAFKGGLRCGMRVLAVGRVSIQPGERMPRGDDDYSPIQRTKDLIVEAIERNSSALVLIRVDSLTV